MEPGTEILDEDEAVGIKGEEELQKELRTVNETGGELGRHGPQAARAAPIEPGAQSLGWWSQLAGWNPKAR